ncbi:MAG: apolipoprotein N-acyltransferase, partial [Bacteroidota bacterium]|nr:apolipoprotein N-acyltransferase [Bacteroidota bacterium]
MKSLFIFDSQKKYLLLLGVSSSVILGLSFPPLQFGVLVCFGFVPFLLLTDKIDSYSRFFRYSYFTFFIFSLISLYWVGGFTHGKDPYLMIAGTALFLWEPLVLSLPAVFYFFIKKRLNNMYSAIAFPFIWITMEWLYALGELAFPWLHIGNTQTYHLDKIQFADITGVYGISFWILTINVLVYFLVKQIQSTKISRISYYLALCIALIYLLPSFYQVDEKSFHNQNRKAINVGIIQPNVDPWDKWEGANTFLGRWNQTQHYLKLIGDHINDSLDIAVLPESAVLLNLPAYPQQLQEFNSIIDNLNISVITGYVRVQYYEKENAPPTSSLIKGTNVRYDSFNSIMFVEPHSTEVQTYSKMRLVPFAERIPYADKVSFLIEPLRWGVGISNWGLAHDSTVFVSKKIESKFLAMVCYESIFPEFVSKFVDNGAEFLVFITNDSW